jgi:outer membrane receptor for ferrienterochelin and colicins
VPERSHSFTLSAETIHFFSSGRGFQFLAEGFYTRLNNVFVTEEYERGDGRLDLMRTNGDGAIVAGVNLEANWVAAPNFQINSGFTLQMAKYTEPEEWSSNVEPQRRMFRAPNTYGFITALYSPTPRLDLSLSGVYTGSMLIQHFGNNVEGHPREHDREFLTPAFFDFGLRAAYTFDLRDNVSLQLNAGVRNIFNSFQREFDYGAFRDPDFIFGPALPRTFFVGMRLMI